MRRILETWVRIRQLKADPTDQVIVSFVYFFTAILAYARPEGQIFKQLAETMGITPIGVGGGFLLFSGLTFRFSPIVLLQYILLLIPLIALVSYIIWYVFVTPTSSFVTTVPATAFLIVIVKNSFTAQRGRG